MNQQLTYQQLKDRIDNYITNADDLKLIDNAFRYAYDFHEGEKRLTGDDYIQHLLNVAYILAEINADTATICAGLLHDVLEENDDNKEELVDLFGETIVNIIEGVTKINKLNFDGDKKAIIESHRKILVGLSEDVRVIIVKLADRLHNMRTLWVLSPKSQKEKANETLDILVPIASRLGMNTFKSELEDLSLRYSKPDTYFYIVEKLNQTRNERDLEVNKMIDAVSKILDQEGIDYKIKGRAKSIYSIYKKLDKGKSFNDIYDLLALRIYVSKEHECYQVLGLIHSKFKHMPKRFKDYIAMPKSNMYQSLHTTVFGVDEHIFEIQIRTYEMDQIAEHGIASHWSYKEHGSTKADLQNAMEQKLQFFRSLIEIKNDNNSDEEFVKTVQNEVLRENVYVFTPKGDVIELPVGSTPIDFAYRVHSGVGDKMVGAIVNGSIVPLDYVLQNNDIVKINTNKNSVGPSKEWINMAYTSQAKSKIKAFFNKTQKEDYVKLGEEVLIREVKKRKIPLAEFFASNNINKILEELKYKDQTELYVNLGNNKIPVGSVINIVYNDNISKEDLILKRVINSEVKEINSKDDIIVEGIDRIKVNIASCCKPIPGDEIVGYITKGHGITIHRSICPNITDNEERLISVHWNKVTTKKYPALLLVHAMESKNLLLDIIAHSSNSDITIQSINAINSSDNFMYEITVLINDLVNLNKFINELTSLSNIINVERIIK